MPVEAALSALAERNGITGGFDSEGRVKALALKEIQDEGRKGGLVGMEIVDGLVVAGEEWTPGNVSFQFFFSLFVCAFSLLTPSV